MYENNNNVSIDWKGLFLKVIIVAIIVFAIFKGYEYFSNRSDKSKTVTTDAATQLFNANLESLRQAGENYYDNTNFPSEGQTVMATLGELATKGDIKELYDEDGNACSRENSYVSLTNDNGQYKLKATLTCGGTSNYTVVMIGCECEQNKCTITSKEETENTVTKNTSNNSASKNSSSSKSTKTANSSSSKSTASKSTGKQVNVYNNYNNNSNNVNSNNTNSNNNNKGSNNASDNNAGNSTNKPTTKKPTTTRKPTTNYDDDYNTQKYTVTFDSNGGTSVSSQTVNKYDTAYRPSNPRKSNATFVGWYYNGRLFDFSTPITSNIRLEAYYWETKSLTKQVYSAGWDTYGTTYVTITHKLAVPSELQNNNNIRNVRIKSVGNARTMSSVSDLNNYSRLHSATFDGYKYTGAESYSTNTNGLGRMSNIYVRKENSYQYDRWVVWNANVYSQCPTPWGGYYDGNGYYQAGNCTYGIVYTVVWQYEIIRD